MDCKKLGFASRQIHAGKEANSAGALVTPIYQTSTFEFESVEQGGARFAGKEAGYMVVFCYCAVAYLIAWTCMKSLVPRYKKVEV